jgi:transposase InsO family protein
MGNDRIEDDQLGEAKHREAVALFRYGLIADLRDVPRRGLYKKLREKAARDYEIPGSTRRRVAPETLRGWLRDFRRGGFEALLPKPRSDNGLTRAIPREVADLLLETKDQNRALSVPLLIDKVHKSGKVPAELVLAPATVHRLLAQHGLNKPGPSEISSKDRRHFAYEKAGELWMSDVMHGPSVPVSDKRKKKTYLIALIDDATRIVPYAAFTLSENTAAFLPVFEQSILRRGIPKRLYVDNGAVYRSHHLSIVCAKLGITLIHARPYQPQGKGKQERYFRTVRMQFLAGLSPSALVSLDALNRAFWGWVEGEYHQAPHRGLDGECPADRWARQSDEVRLATGDLGDLFLFEQKRKVQKDRTVSLDGVLYEVDAALVGETVLLRYDPSRKRKPVQIWHRGQYMQMAKPVDAYANCFVRRDRHLSELDSPAEFTSGIQLSNLSDEGGE